MAESAKVLLISPDQCNFSNFELKRDHKLETIAKYRSLQQHRSSDSEIYSRKRSWPYDDPDLKQAIRDGTYHLDPLQLYLDFIPWASSVNIVYLQNWLTGEQLKVMAPRRGNIAYSNKVTRRIRDLTNDASSFFDSYLLFPGRDNYYMTNALFLTLTYDHSKLTAQEAWFNNTRYINAFKTKVKRLYPGKELLFLVFHEGTSSDYPSPHIVVFILDGFFRVEKHRSTFKKHLGLVTYRIPRGDHQQRFRSKWPYGTIDIQGIVEGKVSDDQGKGQSTFYYASKYGTKSLRLATGDKPIDIETNTALHTLAWNKLSGARTVISSKLRRSLSDPSVRLDRDFHKSQQANLEWELKKVSEISTSAFFRYSGSVKCKMEDYISFITEKPPPVPPGRAMKYSNILKGVSL